MDQALQKAVELPPKADGNESRDPKKDPFDPIRVGEALV
jgi:hypothetical protein